MKHCMGTVLSSDIAGQCELVIDFGIKWHTVRVQGVVFVAVKGGEHGVAMTAHRTGVKSSPASALLVACIAVAESKTVSLPRSLK